MFNSVLFKDPTSIIAVLLPVIVAFVTSTNSTFIYTCLIFGCTIISYSLVLTSFPSFVYNSDIPEYVTVLLVPPTIVNVYVNTPPVKVLGSITVFDGTLYLPVTLELPSFGLICVNKSPMVCLNSSVLYIVFNTGVTVIFSFVEAIPAFSNTYSYCVVVYVTKSTAESSFVAVKLNVYVFNSVLFKDPTSIIAVLSPVIVAFITSTNSTFIYFCSNTGVTVIVSLSSLVVIP